jgi:HK97 family phage major capsid protein
MISSEQEKLARTAVDAWMRRQFHEFNARVETPRVPVAELFDLRGRGYIAHPYRAYLEETAARYKIPYDPQKPVLELRDLAVASHPQLVSASEVVDPADALRPYMVTSQQGVQIETGLVGDTTVPFTSATSTPAWLTDETTAVTPSTPTVSAKTLKPKNVAVVVRFSRKFAKQTNADTFVARELLRTIGSELDRVVLQGATGNAEPDGLHEAPDLQIVAGGTLSGASANHMLFLSTDEDAMDESVSFLGTPAVREALQNRERASGSGFIWDNNQVAGRPARVTTNLPAGSLVIGPWPQIYLGIWGGIQVEINPYNPSNTLFQAGIIEARVIVSCDVAVRHANSFVWASSVT